MTIRLSTYSQFVETLNTLGFLPFSSNTIDYPNLGRLGENTQWFTDDPDTDPWQWKIRLVEERQGVFAKVLCGKPAFISREWYPFFLAARRGELSFEDAYEEGRMSHECQRIMALPGEGKPLAVHEIKLLAGFEKGSQSRFEGALATLQMGFFITVSGAKRKTTLLGQPYGWPGTEYQTVEAWAWPEVLERAAAMEPEEAGQRLVQRMREVLPAVGEKQARKFLGI